MRRFPFPRRRGRQTAAEVLVVTLLAFGLASLVNADALVRKAETTKELGAARDRSLAVWHPVQDVSHVFQLYRLRQVGGWLVGEPSYSTPPTTSELAGPTTTAGPAATTTTLPPPPELRRPTASAPLRVYAGGDSMMHDVSDSVLRLAAEDPLLDVSAHYEISSGLTRPDYFDWPAAIEADVEEHDPEVVFLLFGANDAQGIVDANGTVHDGPPDSPGFEREYRRRVEAVMDQFADGDRLVFWIGLPPMRDAGYHERTRVLNDIYETAAEDRPWMVYVDLDELFGDGEGAFGDSDLRKGDGIHFNREGSDLLAQHLLDLVEDELPSGSRPRPTSPSTTRPTTPTTRVPVATEG